MLDQNTDRMWYVIGAVIIGAAIILIMNSTMPQVFASVGGIFTDKTNQVTAEIQYNSTNNNPNLYTGGEYHWKDVATGQGTTMGDRSQSVLQRNIKVEPGATYELIYTKIGTIPPLMVLTQSGETMQNWHNGIYSMPTNDVRIRQLRSDGPIVSSGAVYWRFTAGENEQFVSITTGNVAPVTVPFGQFELTYNGIQFRKIGNGGE